MATLSNAQSLRVIGQELARLGVDAFNLERRGDDYIVCIESRKLAGTENETLGKKIRERFFGVSPGREVPDRLRLTGSQILRSDIARRHDRKPSQEIADLNELSLLLRALGSFLDENEADDFIVFWSKQWVKVVFANREENFSVLDLYNIGTHMYLKRANRRSLQR